MAEAPRADCAKMLAEHWLGLAWTPFLLLAWEAAVRLLQVPL